MKRADHKSDCPINFAVEILGDSWSLLIVRDMANYGKKTFNEFLASEERIGSSMLAKRLAHLEEKGIIRKQIDKTDKRKILYSLTESGLNLIPIMYELAVWGAAASPHSADPSGWLTTKQPLANKAAVLQLWRDAVASGSSLYNGPRSVVSQFASRGGSSAAKGL